MIRETRKDFQLRRLKAVKDFIPSAAGSVLMSFGNTRVICTATIEEKIPPFLANQGWLTAEYAMLPGSTITRKNRDGIHKDGRNVEIQRLIGRSLRSVIDLHKIGERTIKIDCDVIEADGGTRTCAISGSFIALCLACEKLLSENTIKTSPIKSFAAAVSVGVVEGISMLDLCYEEDSHADVDMNIIMNSNNEYIEIQGCGEGNTFDQKQLNKLLTLGRKGIRSIIAFQKRTLKDLMCIKGI